MRNKFGLGMLLAGALAIAVAIVAPGAKAQSSKNLPGKYKKWLDEEVIYIISAEERATFLRQVTDEGRDKFIEQFWLARDPTPGTPENEYKTEHYKRIEYANLHFSHEWASEGWRTDRGKIWIILGPPQTRQFHTSGGQIYPMELWFYSTNEPSLPPFFNVLFYQKDGVSDFRLYSPYLDGPDKLVRASGVENNRRNGYKFLRDYNVELAYASLSLIPSDPGSLDSPGLASDAMLMKIINIKDDKFHKEKIGMNRRLQEEVSSRIIRDPNAMQVAVLPMRDAGGEDFIHYALQIPEPADYTLTRYKDKYYLAMEVKARVLDAKKNLIYESSREAISYFEEKELDDVRSRPYSFEDRLPVVSGNYLVEFSLLNRATRSYYKASATVEVEAQPASSIAVGRPLFIQKCGASTVAEEPFFMGGSRCTPQARLELPGGDRASVNLLIPVYVPIPTAETAAQPLKIQYTMGRLDRSVQPKVVEDSLDRRRVNKFGTLMVGKSLPLAGLADGSYILSIQVSDPVTKKTTGTTVPVRLGGAPLPPPNIMTAAEGQKDEQSGNNDYWRGLCARAQSENEKAKMLFARALQRNDKNLGARSQLAGFYFEAGDYQKVTSLLEAGDISKISEADTIRKLVASLNKTGQLQRAISTAEDALKRIEPSAGLYQELAGLYDQAGQPNRAREAREEARKLTAQKPSQK